MPNSVDFVDYAEELEKPEGEEVAGSNGSYGHSTEAAVSVGIAKKLTFVPENFSSPPRSVDVSSNVFKAYDFDKTYTPKLSKTEFEFSDAHSPVSASKYIERSLHDLDDLINLRRLELSELKRSHSQRPGGAQEHSNPLHQAKSSAGRLNTSLPVNSADGSPNPAASPSVSQSLSFPFCLSLFLYLPRSVSNTDARIIQIDCNKVAYFHSFTFSFGYLCTDDDSCSDLREHAGQGAQRH